MATTNLNIRVDKDIKEQADNVFSNLGLNMTTAINVFLRMAIRENGIPFELKINNYAYNEITMEAIQEGRRIARDPKVKGYTSIDELKEALDV